MVTVLPHLEFYWSAFMAVTADRQVGDGIVGRIPYTAISTYCDDFGVEDPDDRERVATLVNEMDGVFREVVMAGLQRERSRAEAKAKARSR